MTVFPLLAILVLAVIAGWLIFGDRLAAGEPRNELEFRAERLGWVFEELEADGYDTTSPLEWHYVFMHREYAPLVRLGEELQRRGYERVSVEEIREPENEFVEHKVIFRHAEVHSEETLAARNIEFKDLASRYGVDMYDGSWVVDPEGMYECDDA